MLEILGFPARKLDEMEINFPKVSINYDIFNKNKINLT